jgi:hypothetical protein
MPGKFSKVRATVTAGATATIQSTDLGATTHEGGIGFSRDPKSELFLLAVTNMVSEQTFYEGGKERDQRFVNLIRQVAIEDPDWVARFVPYLRDTLNMRSASVVMAAELVRAALAAKDTRVNLRSVVGSAIVRADEPAEMLAYWTANYGRRIPQPVKRGVADAVARLYTERNTIKYDGSASAWRFGDVVDLVHPAPTHTWQTALYKYLLDARHKRDNLSTENLPTLTANRAAMALSTEEFRAAFSAEFVQNAGLTWETASSKYGALDARFWEAMIPSMGYMALLRNLRNFDEANVSGSIKMQVALRLAAPEEVAKSRQLPLRFYSAWANAKGMAWGMALENALNLSLANVPALPGRTLVLVDMSGSMNSPLSARSKIARDKAAAVFGSAIALRSDKANLVQFGTGSEEVHFHAGDSVLRTVDRFKNMGGTQTMEAILKHYDGQDRIVILTDEQAFAWGDDRAFAYAFGIGYRRGGEAGMQQVEAIAAPIYTFNLAGYEHGHLPSGSANRFTFGGLTDAGFKAIALLERGSAVDWPF